MREIVLSGTIGWKVTAQTVREELAQVEDYEMVRFVIDSLGGDCYAMVGIFNVIQDFARRHSQSIETYIQGCAMSAASVIALAAKAGNKANKIVVEDTSIFMIHNCWTFVCGDSRELAKVSQDCGRIDQVIRNVYGKISGLDDGELVQMMNDETYLYGQEIVDAGFADQVIQTDDEGITNKSDRIINAKLGYTKMMKDMKAQQLPVVADATEQITAFVAFGGVPLKDGEADREKTTKGSSNTEVKTMDVAQLQQSFPQVYEQVYNCGVEEERKRVTSHLKMAQDSGDVTAAMEFINSGVSCADNEVTAKYHEVFTRQMLAKARGQDGVADTTTPPTPDGEKQAMMNAFAKETGLEV